MEFDEPLSGSCLINDAVSVTGSAGALAVSSTLTSNRRRIVTTPTDMQPTTAYTVALANVCDYSGNEATGDVLSFTTTALADSDGGVRPAEDSSAGGVLKEGELPSDGEESAGMDTSNPDRGMIPQA